MKIPRKYRNKCKVYKHFARKYDGLDYSDEVMLAMFQYESWGKGDIKSNNGFAIGKKWMDVTISMWKEDLDSGLLTPAEYREYQEWLASLKNSST